VFLLGASYYSWWACLVSLINGRVIRSAFMQHCYLNKFFDQSLTSSIWTSFWDAAARVTEGLSAGLLLGPGIGDTSDFVGVTRLISSLMLEFSILASKSSYSPMTFIFEFPLLSTYGYALSQGCLSASRELMRFSRSTTIVLRRKSTISS